MLFWTDETRLMDREVYGEGEALMVQRIPHHLSSIMEAVLWYGHVWLPVEPGYWFLLMM